MKSVQVPLRVATVAVGGGCASAYACPSSCDGALRIRHVASLSAQVAWRLSLLPIVVFLSLEMFSLLELTSFVRAEFLGQDRHGWLGFPSSSWVDRYHHCLASVPLASCFSPVIGEPTQGCDGLHVQF